MERWVDKVAIVTGASVGIGAEICRYLLSHHIRVVGLARRLDKLQELEITSPGRFFPISCDMSQDDQILTAFEWVDAHLGGVDILVNNAGVGGSSTLIEGNPTEWRNILNVNVVGLCLCTREAIKSMKARLSTDAHIIHIGSILGSVVPTSPYNHFYSASKHAVKALTEGLRQELRDLNSPIKITCISPGLVKTDIIVAAHGAEFSEAVFKARTYLQPADIAQAVIYALSTPAHVQVHELIVKPIGEIH